MTLLPNLAFLRLKSLAMRKKKDERGENRVESLLRPVQVLQGDSDCDSDLSEISDVFEEFHKNSYLRSQPRPKRYYTKHEADVKTMDEFTDDFKETMGRVRSDLDIGEKLLQENPEDIQKIFGSPRDAEVFPKTNRDIVEALEDATNSIPRREELKQTRKLSDSSSGSIIWHMLATNSDQKKFEISPPGFDAFKQKKPHWLQRASVSWIDIDHATLKCENWLEKHCNEISAKRK